MQWEKIEGNIRSELCARGVISLAYIYITTELKILEEGETILTVEPNENVTLYCRAVGAKLVGITAVALFPLLG